MTTRPIRRMESVYIVRLARRMAAATVPGWPSFTMKYAHAGCPPVADGVMAEK